jgi:hypothetical protein
VAGRPKDLEVIAELEALLEERGGSTRRSSQFARKKARAVALPPGSYNTGFSSSRAC